VSAVSQWWGVSLRSGAQVRLCVRWCLFAGQLLGDQDEPQGAPKPMTSLHLSVHWPPAAELQLCRGDVTNADAAPRVDPESRLCLDQLPIVSHVSGCTDSQAG
jgi:hypothetical protein